MNRIALVLAARVGGTGDSAAFPLRSWYRKPICEPLLRSALDVQSFKTYRSTNALLVSQNKKAFEPSQQMDVL